MSATYHGFPSDVVGHQPGVEQLLIPHNITTFSTMGSKLAEKAMIKCCEPNQVHYLRWTKNHSIPWCEIPDKYYSEREVTYLRRHLETTFRICMRENNAIRYGFDVQIAKGRDSKRVKSEKSPSGASKLKVGVWMLVALGLLVDV